ncbi:MAG: 4-alpha-glucanotransferase [Acidobacteriota bacterium]
MKLNRSSGILLHPTSLPSRWGIGDFGPEAYRFVDFLRETGQQVWQVLPLGPTGMGDSPYSCFSAFAGNPLLISLDRLVEEGLLEPGALECSPHFPSDRVDYGTVSRWKLPLLKRAFDRFRTTASEAMRAQFQEFCSSQSYWLPDYALFRALRRTRNRAPWNQWEEPLLSRDPETLHRYRRELAADIEYYEFREYLFFRQWSDLKAACSGAGIQVMGDIPIFIAHDSADVWAHPEQFQLDEHGHPTVVAGVPPDYFSATGQRWGNPLYNWAVMAESGYRWWTERFRMSLSLFDLVRLDHFRGFEAYWEVPASEETAINGRWVSGPGVSFFERIQDSLGELPIVAENLGLITPEVEALREQMGFPGMGVIQFAFGGDPEDNPFLPHKYERHLVVYTGTHDNDTTVGWWNSAGDDTTLDRRQFESEREFARKYMNTDGREIHWDCIRTVLASVAELAIIPLQDVLGLGSEARMNMPARPEGNWSWRFDPRMLTDEVRTRLREMTVIYGRAPKWPSRPGHGR